MNKVVSKHFELSTDAIQAELLSFYAGRSRYPGDYEPLTEEDYKEALSLAISVYSWISNIINNEKTEL